MPADTAELVALAAWLALADASGGLDAGEYLPPEHTWPELIELSGHFSRLTKEARR